MFRLLTPLMLIALAAVAFFYVADPVLVEIEGLQVREQELSAALESASSLTVRIDELTNQHNQFSDQDKENLIKMLPENIDNVRLIIDLNNIAKKYGMTVRNPSIAGEAAGGEAAAPSRTAGRLGSSSQADQGEEGNSVVISFSVNGSYSTIKSFLNDLTHSLRIVDPDALSFSASQTGTNQEYKISLRTYWLK